MEQRELKSTIIEKCLTQVKVIKSKKNFGQLPVQVTNHKELKCFSVT